MADRRPVETLVERDDGVVFTMRGAGGGTDLPHDLVHAVVEQQLGVADGIWGCVADGVVWRSMTHRSGRQPPHAADRSDGSSANGPRRSSEPRRWPTWWAASPRAGRCCPARSRPPGCRLRPWSRRRRSSGTCGATGPVWRRATSGWSSGSRRLGRHGPAVGRALSQRPPRLPGRRRHPPAGARPLDEVGELQDGQHPEHLEDVAARDRGQPLGTHPAAHRAGVQHPRRQVAQPVPRSARPLRPPGEVDADAADRLDHLRR